MIEFTHGSEVWRAIHEVHYETDGDANPTGFGTNPAIVMATSEDEPGALQRVLDRMREALDKPIIVAAHLGWAIPEQEL